jgi:hypothetical protein
MDAQTLEQPTITTLSFTEQIKILMDQGLGVTAIALKLNRPIGSIGPIMSRIRRDAEAFQNGAVAGTKLDIKAQGNGGAISGNASPIKPTSPEEKARVSALRLLNKVRAGTQGISKERVAAANIILTKIKQVSEDDQANQSIYSTMQDKELADHIVSVAVQCLGVQVLQDTLDRLKGEGLVADSMERVATL